MWLARLYHERGGKLMGVGMPQALLLQQFGELIRRAFDEIPYHVGSSLRKKSGWRDVDVRLILPDEKYEAMGFGNPRHPHRNERWRAFVMAFSALGKEMTGLPIDFQIQQQTQANEEFGSGKLGIYDSRKNWRSALFDVSTVK